MKDNKKLTGTKVKLTRGKRVSLRCPLAIDRTDLEHNYDSGSAQICLTVENMGGGGVTNDSVESAIVVIRLYDAQGTLIPCTKNEYFAKMLRFGDEGLQSGAQITFRLIPDCDGGLRVADLEVYISRVRYADGSVTDYLRGDFFDLPGDAIPLQKKHKKEIDAITEKFGATALYVPEEMTEIIWRCTCGEFCEADQCSTCGVSKKELFDYFKDDEKKAGAILFGAMPADSDRAEGESDSTDTGNAADPANAPATDATTEYDTGAFVAGMLGTNADPASAAADQSGDLSEDGAGDQEALEFRAAPSEKKPDKLKISLIIAIAASGVVLVIIIILLIIAMFSRSNGDPGNTGDQSDTDSTPSVTTTADDPDTPDNPDNPDMSDDEKLVRAYLEQNDFDNALGYARKSGCSQELINEVLTAAVDYYTNVAPDADKALQYATELNDTSSIEALTLQKYNEAMQKGDYTAAIAHAQKLTADKDAKLSAAAEALLQSQLAANDFDAAMQTASTYPTTTTAEDIALNAISYYVNTQDFDKALALAEETGHTDQTAAIAKNALDYYVAQQNYDRAADYVKLTGDPNDIASLVAFLSESTIKNHLPDFFAYLTFEQKQAVHASVMDSATVAGVIDVYGNAYWGTDQSYISAETGKTVVSIKVSKFAVALLFSDGTVEVRSENGSNQYDVALWTDIVAIDLSDRHIVGLKADGTVVATGSNSHGQCNVTEITDAVAIAAGGYHTLILRADRTVTSLGMTDTSEWTDIIAISAGHLHSIGLRADGTVVAAGDLSAERCDVDGWSGVVAISAGETCTVGLKADGTLLIATGDELSGDVSGMTDVIWVSAGSSSVTALRADGTLITTGSAAPDLTFVSIHEIPTDLYGIN